MIAGTLLYAKTKTVKERSAMKGKIKRIIDHGTIVTVYVQDSNCRTRVVNFDHRMFRDWYEAAMDYTGKKNLTGMWVKVEGDQFDGEGISLPESRKMDLENQ